MKKSIICLIILLLLFSSVTATQAAFVLDSTLTFGGKASIQSGWSNTCSTSSGEDPTNKTTGVSIAVAYWNVSINDADGNTTSGWLNCSNGNTTSWTDLANGTRSLNLSTLSYSTNYTVWLNFSDEHCSVNETFWFVTEGSGWSNTCPVSSSESPSNKTTGVSISVSYWNVTINDADGNNTWGNITCSNGNTTSWNDLANGTRSLNLSTLDYSTNYTVWLNFTDGNSSCSINETYWFVTQSAPTSFVLDVTLTFGAKLDVQIQESPSLSNEYPTNGSTNIPVNPTLRIYASDSELMNITFRTNASGSWQDVGSNNSVSTGYYYQTTANMNGIDVKYWWSINATDPAGSGNWTNETYSFTTYDNFIADDILTFGGKASILSELPQVSNVLPTNTSTEADMYPTLSIDVADAQSVFNITWETNATGSWLGFDWNSSCSDGTYSQIAGWANQSNTTYWWGIRVNDTDGNWANATYRFKTANYSWSNASDWWTFYYAGQPPALSNETPTDGSTNLVAQNQTFCINASDADGDTMNLTFKIDDGSGWVAIGTNISVGNGTYCQYSIIEYSKSYNWSVDCKDNESWTNETYQFSTQVNETPVHSELDPYDGKTGVALSIGLLSFKINDNEGDLMNYSVTTAPSIGSGSGNDKSNGTYTVVISSLSYSTTYYWTLKVTDGISWDNQTYSFTTISSSGNPPNAPTSPSPSDGATGRSVDIGSLSCSVSDPDADVLNVTFKWGNGTLIGYDYPVASGGTASVGISTLEFNTTYEWYTIANDTADETQSAVWDFTTEVESSEATLTPTSYAFGTVDFGANKESTDITVNNIGDVEITKVELKVSDMQDINAFMSWTIESTPGINEYTLKYYTEARGNWSTLSDTYTDIEEIIGSGNETTFKLKLFMPTLSTFRDMMYGTLTLQYTGGSAREIEFDFSVRAEAASSNQTAIQINLTDLDLIPGGMISSDMFYITIPNNMSVNTTINIPSTFTGKWWFFWTEEKTLVSKEVYGITSTWNFAPVATKGSLTSFTIDVDDFGDYYGFVVVPNPGFFQSGWWLDTLNNARDKFMQGESLV